MIFESNGESWLLHFCFELTPSDRNQHKNPTTLSLHWKDRHTKSPKMENSSLCSILACLSVWPLRQHNTHPKLLPLAFLKWLWMAELRHTPRHCGSLFHMCMTVHVNVGCKALWAVSRQDRCYIWWTSIYLSHMHNADFLVAFSITSLSSYKMDHDVL